MLIFSQRAHAFGTLRRWRKPHQRKLIVCAFGLRAALYRVPERMLTAACGSGAYADADLEPQAADAIVRPRPRSVLIMPARPQAAEPTLDERFGAYEVHWAFVRKAPPAALFGPLVPRQYADVIDIRDYQPQCVSLCTGVAMAVGVAQCYPSLRPAFSSLHDCTIRLGVDQVSPHRAWRTIARLRHDSGRGARARISAAGRGPVRTFAFTPEALQCRQ